jgi:hypothetical protein
MIYPMPPHASEKNSAVSTRPLFEQNYQVLEASGDSELDRIRVRV